MSAKPFIDATTYLRALDPDSKAFTFQTFDDTPADRGELANILHGPLAQHWQTLHKLNRKRAGVYVAVQETDFRGRKQSNIRNIRSVFADDDNTISLDHLPIEPSMIVGTSPGRNHLYYLLDEKMSTANGNKEKFRSVMRGLVAKGSDPACQSIERALRLPGFYNCKYDKPHYIESPKINLDFLNDPIRYDFDHLNRVFKPPEIPKELLKSAQLSTSTRSIEHPFKIALAASALNKIDPDCKYDEWFQIGAALHYESGGGSDGYDLFQKWSMRGEQYKEHDWPTQWDRFKPDGSGKVVTLGTLLHIARSYGWNGRYDLSVPGIAKYIRMEQENNFEYMNQFYGLIPVQQNIKLLYQAKNELGFYGHQLLSERGAVTYFADRTIPEIKYMANPDNNRVDQVPLFDRWTKWDKRRFYEGFTFEPSADIKMGDNPKMIKEGERYNTYLGLMNEGREADCTPILDHIREVWCKNDESRYEYVLNWLARMYQFPGKPAETMIILKSKHGAGKNIILDPLVKSWGRFGKTDKAGDDMTADFNAILIDSVFILVGEASFDSTSKQRAVINTLATQERIGATKKFEDTREIRNCVHVICLSNAEVPIVTLAGDRRVCIYSCSSKYVGNFKYFSELKRKIKEGAMDGFVHYLKNRNIEGYLPMEMPVSERGVKSAIVADDSKSIQPFVRLALESDNFLFPISPGDGYGMSEDNQVPVDRMYDAYCEYCRDMGKGSRNIASKIAFGRRLNDIFGAHMVKQRIPKPDENGKRWYYYVISPIEVLRSDFDDFIGAPHDWGDDNDENEEKDLDFL